MKASDLTPGYYHDGKKTLRKLVSRNGEMVVFQKVAPAYPAPIDISVLHHCPVSEFGKWAKVKLNQEALYSISLDICAMTTMLTPAQVSALKELCQGGKVLGKVRTSLLEKSLIASVAPVIGCFQVTELGKRVLNRADKEIEKSA